MFCKDVTYDLAAAFNASCALFVEGVARGATNCIIVSA
jgi:hypothetical protein